MAWARSKPQAAPAARAALDRVGAGEPIGIALLDVAEKPDQIVVAGAVADTVIGLCGDSVRAFRAGRREDHLPNLGDLPVARWRLADGEWLMTSADWTPALR